MTNDVDARSTASSVVSVTIERTWEGRAARPDEVVQLDFALHAEGLAIEVDAPLHGDPAPHEPIGSTPGLWDHEVVELFVLGEGGRYLEIELGPHGHYLALELAGPRRIASQGFPIRYDVEHGESRWRGSAWVDARHLPAGIHAYNAYAIHGTGDRRRHLAANGIPGTRPDFHRLDSFLPLPRG